MATDVLITPASGLIEFKDTTTKASILLDGANNLIISTTSGEVSIGTPGTNVYVGDGVNSVDLIFEQNGAVRAANTKTLTIGSAGSFVTVLSPTLTGTAVASNLTLSGNLIVNGTTTLASGGTSLSILNDISDQFDGVKTVFALRQDQTNINNIVDSIDLEVVINGVRLTPYVKQITYPWLMDYDSFRGFRVSGGNLIIYNAPYIGDSASLIFRNVSTTARTKKYPYSATTVALGD